VRYVRDLCGRVVGSARSIMLGPCELCGIRCFVTAELLPAPSILLGPCELCLSDVLLQPGFIASGLPLWTIVVFTCTCVLISFVPKALTPTDNSNAPSNLFDHIGVFSRHLLHKTPKVHLLELVKAALNTVQAVSTCSWTQLQLVSYLNPFFMGPCF
jgi:hypothetical protein